MLGIGVIDAVAWLAMDISAKVQPLLRRTYHFDLDAIRVNVQSGEVSRVAASASGHNVADSFLMTYAGQMNVATEYRNDRVRMGLDNLQHPRVQHFPTGEAEAGLVRLKIPERDERDMRDDDGRYVSDSGEGAFQEIIASLRHLVSGPVSAAGIDDDESDAAEAVNVVVTVVAEAGVIGDIAFRNALALAGIRMGNA